MSGKAYIHRIVFFFMGVYPGATSALRFKVPSEVRTSMAYFASGFALLWIPYIRYIGYIVIGIGASILYHSGTEPQGVHLKNEQIPARLFTLSVLLFFATPFAFQFVAITLVSPSPQVSTAAAHQEMLDVAFMFYFALYKVFSLICVISIVALSWNVSSARNRNILLLSFLVFLGLLIFEILNLGTSSVLPYNNWPGTEATGAYVLSLMAYLNRFLVYYVIPYAIMIYAFFRIRRDLVVPSKEEQKNSPIGS